MHKIQEQDTDYHFDTNYQPMTLFFKAVADSLRLNILHLLRQDAFGVLELCLLLKCKQSNLSHHLKILLTAGLVETKKEGNFIFYRRGHQQSDARLQVMHDKLFYCLDQQVIAPQQKQQLAHIQQQRTKRSQQFFEQNADKINQHQILIADHQQYHEHICHHFSTLPLNEQVIEIGPGKGEFLALLSNYYKQVIAIDNSKAMLEKAKKQIKKQELKNIQLIYGDVSTVIEKQFKVDCIILNMVLHHMPSPAAVIEQLARHLKPAGCLVITDLCQHPQNWVRECCGDLWLGFLPDEITTWAQKAGLGIGKSSYLTQSNGFQVQIRQLIKQKD